MSSHKAMLSSLATLSLCLSLTACNGREEASARATGDADAIVSIDGCQNYEASPGVTKDKILLGSSFASSGPLAVLAQLAVGFDAYFDYANAELGGVDGRDVEVVSYDDAYDPSRTVTNVNKLVDEDEVLALFSILSTAGNYAIWDRTEATCVPNLMSSTAAADFKETMDHRWSLNNLFPFRLEAVALANTLAKDQGAKTLAVLYEAGDFGQSFLDGLKSVGDDLGLEVVASESFQATDPAVTTQVATLADSGADAVLVVAAGTMCAQALNTIADTSWKPVIAVPYTCTSKSLMTLADPAASQGVISVTSLKDPASPRWSADPAVLKYKAAVQKYAPKADENDAFVSNGWFYGEVVYNILKNAKELTRQSVMSSALSLDALTTAMTLPGVELSTSVDDATVLESVQVEQYDSRRQDWAFLDGAEVLPEGESAVVEYSYADTE